MIRVYIVKDSLIYTTNSSRYDVVTPFLEDGVGCAGVSTKETIDGIVVQRTAEEIKALEEEERRKRGGHAAAITSTTGRTQMPKWLEPKWRRGSCPHCAPTTRTLGEAVAWVSWVCNMMPKPKTITAHPRAMVHSNRRPFPTSPHNLLGA